MKIFFLFIISIIISLSAFAQTDKYKSQQYFDTANTYFDQENYEVVINYCDSAIKYDAENLEAYAYRGVSKFSLDRYEDAISDFDLTLILNNGYAEIYYYRGLCKLELGANNQACEDFYDAYNLDYKDVMKIIEANCSIKEEKK